jgi:hypothetical protein
VSRLSIETHDIRGFAVIVRTGHGANRRDRRIAGIGRGSEHKPGISLRWQNSVRGYRAL